jgi:hypothetical protein
MISPAEAVRRSIERLRRQFWDYREGAPAGTEPLDRQEAAAEYAGHEYEAGQSYSADWKHGYK